VRIRWLLILAGLALLTSAACSSGESNTPVLADAEGTLAGSVSIGPLCPVEPCSQDIGDTYTSRQLQLQGESTEAVLVQLSANGTFQALVPVGRYSVGITNCEFLGCSGSLPVTVDIREGETFNLNIVIDTGIRSAVQPPSSYTQLSNDLRNAGADVETGSDINQPFFSVPGRIMSVNGADVQVFEYATRDEAQTTSMVMWVAAPHFYTSRALIVLYVGDDEEVLALLAGSLGSQFAGGSSVSVDPGITNISEEADRTARRELSDRLGVAPEDLMLV